MLPNKRTGRGKEGSSKGACGISNIRYKSPKNGGGEGKKAYLHSNLVRAQPCERLWGGKRDRKGGRCEEERWQVCG